MGEGLDQFLGDDGGAPSALVLSDLPLGEGAEFNFEPIIETLCEFISSAPRDAPFNICISGGWGTGKTTLLKCLEASFKSSAEADNGDPQAVKYVPVWFDPWKLESEGEVRDALARSVLRKIEEDADFVTGVKMQIERKNVIRVLSERLFKVNPDDVSSSYRTEGRLQGTFVEVEDIFKRVAEVYLEGEGERDVQRRLVIFVDDLDRCQPARITKVLESVKLFFDLPGLVFVFALDYRQLEKAVQGDYKMQVDEAQEYMEKLFQLKIDLPPKGAAALREYLAGNLAKVGVELGGDGVSAAIVERFGHNLRNLKRTVNWLNFHRHLISKVGSSDQEAVIRWLYLDSTMTRSMEQAASRPDGLANLALALEFLAHGGFLLDPETQSRYLETLEGGDINYIALIAYAIVADAKEEPPKTDLNYAQRDMVEAIREDGALEPTLKVIREGEDLLINTDLTQVIYLTRSASGRAPDDMDLPKRDPGLKEHQDPLTTGNPLKAQEWNALGDELISASSNLGAYVSYLMAVLMAPTNAIYLADLARPYRREASYDAIRELHHRAYRLEPESAYVLVEIAQFEDIVIKDEELGSLLYRKVIAQGSATPSVPYYLSMNLQKEARHAEAYLACLDAVIRDPEDKAKRARLAGCAQAASLHDRPADRPVEELRAELEAAIRSGEYPLALAPAEEAKLHARLTEAPDAERAAAQLSRPPF